MYIPVECPSFPGDSRGKLKQIMFTVSWYVLYTYYSIYLYLQKYLFIFVADLFILLTVFIYIYYSIYLYLQYYLFTFITKFIYIYYSLFSHLLQNLFIFITNWFKTISFNLLAKSKCVSVFVIYHRVPETYKSEEY